MYNLYSHLVNNPARCRRFTCGQSLITMFNCRLENRFEDLWSHYNYIVYVVEGRKIWHTSHGSYDLKQGSCVFVKKGASMVEQFFDTEFCFILFFLPDDFICEVLQEKTVPLIRSGTDEELVMHIERTDSVDIFYRSMFSFFENLREPDQALLRLKFSELILTIADNPLNHSLQAYFHSILCKPQTVSLQRIMEDNFCFNLKLEEFSKLAARSLSAFKRDFQAIYRTSPGRWLTERRLDHARNLISNQGYTVSEASFHSGFENVSHFSRAFKLRYGHTPAGMKQLARS
ncbi:MAG: AraC family transcriptional regulator [Chitinophagaceae bacterium]